MLPEKKKLMQQLYSYTYKMVHTCVEIEEGYCGGKLITYRELKGRLAGYLEKVLCDESADVGMSEASRGVAGSSIDEFISRLKELESFLKRFYGNAISIDPEKSLRNQLCLVTEYIATSCPESDADRVDYCPHLAYLRSDISRDKSWVKETMDMPFEVTKIAVPKMYHEVLVSRFGQGYMTPQHQPSTHDYPYYRTQAEVLIGGDTGEFYKEYPQKKNCWMCWILSGKGTRCWMNYWGRWLKKGHPKAVWEPFLPITMRKALCKAVQKALVGA